MLISQIGSIEITGASFTSVKMSFLITQYTQLHDWIA